MKVIKVLMSVLFIIIGCLTVVAPLSIEGAFNFVMNIGGLIIVAIGIFTFYHALKQ